jgi:hypothetical protein
MKQSETWQDFHAQQLKRVAIEVSERPRWSSFDEDASRRPQSVEGAYR